MIKGSFALVPLLERIFSTKKIYDFVEAFLPFLFKGFGGKVS